MRSIHPHKCHLCGWVERIRGGTRQNDGLETGVGGGAAAARLASIKATRRVWLTYSMERTAAMNSAA